MELENTEIIHSSENGDVVLGEFEGRQCVRKSGDFSRNAAEIIAKIDCPYIVKIREIGEDFLITEYADGQDLSQAKIPPRSVYKIALELCDALISLHANNVIHRDIKPSNVILCNDGHIKLIDFDAARVKNPTTDKDTRFVGTDGFAPPEQYGFMQTDARSDIYAFGVTIKLLLGENHNRVPYKHVIEKCMRFNPDERYSSAKAVKFALTTNRFAMFAVPAVLGAAVITAGFLAAFLSTQNPRSEDFIAADSDSSESTVSSEISSVIEPVISASGESIFTPIESASTSDSVVSEPSTSAEESSENTHSNTPIITSTTAASSSTTPVESEPLPALYDFNVYWDILTLPEGFPKLNVIPYSCEWKDYEEYGLYTISLENIPENEMIEIVDTIHNWLGKNSDFSLNGNYFKDWKIQNDNFRVSVQWGDYITESPEPADAKIFIFPLKDESKPQKLNLALANLAVTDYSKRTIKWEDVEPTGDIPKLTDMVSSFSNIDAYQINWFFMDFPEAEAVLQKIIDSFEGEYIIDDIYCNSGCYVWELEGKINGKLRRVEFSFTSKNNTNFDSTPSAFVTIKNLP